MSLWSRILAALTRPRPDGTYGEPGSGNGASSFHLWWEVPAVGPIVEASAVLEIRTMPAVDRLYFWAMQVSFAGGPAGEGAHIGLQHHPRFPGRRAANWGGYAARADGGGLLAGSPSPLPSTPNDVNTRDLPWEGGRPYRLRVRRSSDPAPVGFHGWRGQIEDLGSGRIWVVRDLYTRGSRLVSPLVWTEAFARCEHPTAEARWSDLEVVAGDGTRTSIPSVRVSYQSRVAGGCTNTTVITDGSGVLQRTNAVRQVADGRSVPIDVSV